MGREEIRASLKTPAWEASSLCARVFSPAAAILESEKTLGTRLVSALTLSSSDVKVHYGFPGNRLPSMTKLWVFFFETSLFDLCHKHILLSVHSDTDSINGSMSTSRTQNLPKFTQISFNLPKSRRSTVYLASHAGVFRGARFSSLPTNPCSTEDNFPFPSLANHIVLSKFWKVDLDRRVI